VSIPDSYYFGFTAMTGGVTAIHDIYEIQVYYINEELYNTSTISTPITTPITTNPTTNHTPRSHDKIGGGWGFFSWFFFILVVLLVSYVGYVYVKTQEKQSYKRF
jgi:hypothetical protein